MNLFQMDNPARLRAVRSAASAVVILAAALVAAAERSSPPNFVVIVADDVGFTDFGAYGGEARTPHIDGIAARGVQFANYHTSPLCAPSRAMLLTGVDNHRTGLATIPEVLPPQHRGRPGYSMRLEPGVVTLAGRLQAAGYRTYMSGKWHLGHGDGDLPDAHGFDRSLALDASGADNWEQRPYMPYYRTADWFEDGARTTLPSEFYSSELLVDRLIDYIDSDERQDRPFFAYLPFLAVHIPVQAPRQFTANYDGVYDGGWDRLQERRWRRAQQKGLIREGAPPPRMHPAMRRWEEVAAGERPLLARSMQVHAGMLEAMDHHVGRLIAHLEARGLADETIFIVTSDNGPEPSDPLAAMGFSQWMALQGYTRRLADLGERRSMNYIGAEWASATASPGRLFKFYAAEGALRVPLIVAGPGVESGRLSQAFAYVTDIAPTILDLAGLAMQSGDGEAPISGRSMRGVLAGAADAVHGTDDAVGMEVSGHAALFRGDWKLTRNMPPYGDGEWRLHDIAADPGETMDLSADRPQVARELLDAYAAYAAAVGVLELPADYDVQRQIVRNTLAAQFHHYWRFAAAAAALVLLATLARRHRHRGRREQIPG